MLAPLVALLLASGDPFLGDGHHGNVTIDTRRALSPSVPLSSLARAGLASIELPADAGFLAGDLLLLHRTTSVSGPNDRDAGAFDLSTTDLGQYEFVRLGAANVNGFAVTASLSHDYPAPGSQAVLVHEFAALTVTDAGVVVPANPWNGEAGGIIAFLVVNELTLDGRVDASGAGFRGGAPVVDFAGNDPATFGCVDPDQLLPRGAHKGEGFFGALFGPTLSGLGRSVNGGGGGDCHNSGGGAGSHVGAGGQGGASWDADGARDVGGRGGVKIIVPVDRLTFGGGGGGGESHHGSTNNGGAAGGGIIFVRATSVRGGGVFFADGESSPDVGDASGGAGAGGSVVVEAAQSINCTLAAARGGDGGINPCGCEGTAGGGGGGRVVLSAESVVCPADVKAGLGGHFMSGTNFEFRLARPDFMTQPMYAGSSTVLDAGIRSPEEDGGALPAARRLNVGCGCASLEFAPLLVFALLLLRRRGEVRPIPAPPPI